MSSNASENDIDSDLSGESKFSRVAKWRSSIRSGIKKSKKTTQKLSKQLKNETQKALDTVQQKLPLKNFSSGTSLDNLNGNQRFQSDASSFNPRDVRDWNDNSERVFLQGAWNSQEQLDSHHCSPKKPDGIRKTHTLLASNVEHSAAMARAFVEGPQDSPMSSPRAGSERSNLSAFDADTMYDTARSQAFENNRRPAPQDVTLPNSEEDAFFPPPQTAPPPPMSPISAPTSPQNRSTPPPVPVRRCTSALSNSQPTRGHAPTRSASFRPTPPPPPPPIAEQHTTFTNPLIPEDSQPLEPPQTPVIRNYESARSGFETVDRRQFDTIDMRRQWSINHNYEEQLEHDLDTTLETSTEVWGEVDNADSFDDESAEEYQVEEDFHEEKRDHFSKESNQYRKVLRDDNGVPSSSRSRPDSLASGPFAEGGRSIGSSKGSWDLETSEEGIDDDNSVDGVDADDSIRTGSATPGSQQLTSRLRDTFRSTLRDATKISRVKEMVRYVQRRPRSAIEKREYRESSYFQGQQHDRRRSVQVEWGHLPPPPSGATENDIKRRRILQSLVQSEKAYINSLGILEHDYRQQLLRQPVVEKSYVDRIFGKVTPIYSLHKLFEIALDSAIMDWDVTQRVGDIFTGTFDKQTVLEHYSAYINALPETLKLVQKLCARRTFFDFSTKQQETQGDNLNLFGLMLKPVQRFPQFLLILQDLLKSTPFEHPDRVALEGALTSLDKLTEQLDYRREIQEQRQLFFKLAKLSKTEWQEGENGRVLKCGPATEVLELSGKDGELVELRDGILILTDKGKLLFLLNPKKQSSSKAAKESEIEGCKLKWRCDVKDIHIADFSEDNLSKKLGSRDGIQSDIETLSEIEALVGKLSSNLETRPLTQEINSIKERVEKSLNLVGSSVQTTITIQKNENIRHEPWLRKYVRLSSGINAREWTDAIRAVRIRLVNDRTMPFTPWETPQDDSPTTGADRVMPVYIGSVRPRNDQTNCDLEYSQFCSYASPEYDGSIYVWQANDDFVEISHIKKEDDIVTEHNRLRGRGFDPFIHSIQAKTSISSIMHAYNAIWIFLMDGDVMAMQDCSPFRRFGLTKELTDDQVVQATVHGENGFLITTKSGIVAYAVINHEDQRDLTLVLETLVLDQGSPVRLIPIVSKDETWAWRSGKVKAVKNGHITDEFACRELGSVPLSASISKGTGVWVARGDLPILYLYHAHTKQLLQTFDLSHSAFTVKKSHTFGVSHLTTMANFLVAGTTSGIVIVLPLPKLAVSNPSIVGPAHASAIGHLGRVASLNSIVPSIISSSDSGLDNVTASGSKKNAHSQATLLFSIGQGLKKPREEENKEVICISVWRSGS